MVVACARAAVRWLKKPPEHHHADRHRKAWAAAKTLNAVEQSFVSVSRAGFSLRGPAEALIPLARITRWGHDASDFSSSCAAADASRHESHRGRDTNRRRDTGWRSFGLAPPEPRHTGLARDRRGSRGGTPARESATIGGGRGSSLRDRP